MNIKKFRKRNRTLNNKKFMITILNDRLETGWCKQNDDVTL